MELQARTDFLGKFTDLLRRALRDDHFLDAGAQCGDRLLVEPPDGQHVTREGKLTRHRYVAANRNVEKIRHQARCNRNARAGSVFGNRALGYVNVDIDLVEEVLLEWQHAGEVARVGERDLSGFLHHVSQLAR